MISLSSFIRFHAERAPQRLAIHYAGAAIGYAELYRRIETAAGWLASRGVRPGDIVALLMKNSPAFVELTFAMSHLGAVSLPVNYRLAAEEVGYILDHAGAKLLLCDAELAAAARGFPSVVLLDEPAQHDSTRLGPTAPTAPAPMHAGKPDDLFRLMYTSGTTDRPKGVMHSYNNFYWKCADHVLALGLSAADRLLVAGPLITSVPSTCRAWPCWGSAALSILRDFDPRRARHDEQRLTCAWLAPVMLGGSSPSTAGAPRPIEPALGDRRRRAHARGPHPRLHRPLHGTPATSTASA